MKFHHIYLFSFLDISILPAWLSRLNTFILVSLRACVCVCLSLGCRTVGEWASLDNKPIGDQCPWISCQDMGNRRVKHKTPPSFAIFCNGLRLSSVGCDSSKLQQREDLRGVLLNFNAVSDFLLYPFKNPIAWRQAFGFFQLKMIHHNCSVVVSSNFFKKFDSLTENTNFDTNHGLVYIWLIGMRKRLQLYWQHIQQASCYVRVCVCVCVCVCVNVCKEGCTVYIVGI